MVSSSSTRGMPYSTESCCLRHQALCLHIHARISGRPFPLNQALLVHGLLGQLLRGMPALLIFLTGKLTSQSRLTTCQITQKILFLSAQEAVAMALNSCQFLGRQVIIYTVD